MGIIRGLLYDNYHQKDIPAVMRSEGEALLEARKSPEHLEAITAFFEKREPKFAR
jgi:enoyl-CoA hydratase/carnithine racemase